MLTALIPLVSILAGAGTANATAERMESANHEATAAIRNGLVEQAEALGIPVSPAAVTYVTFGTSFLVHGPPLGANLHTEEEFAAGVDVTFLYVGGTRVGRELPNGFYRVHAIVPAGAEEGQVSFIDASGNVAGTSVLLVRTKEQQDVFLPGSSDPGPAEIPNITSTHIFQNGKEYVDCAGWEPYRVFYYPVN